MPEKRTLPPSMSRLLSERGRGANQASEPRGAELGGSIGQFFAKLAEAAEALSAAPGGTVWHGGELPLNIGGKQGRAVFGYTLRMGLDGMRAERFGDAVPPAGQTQRGAAAPRAPIVDVFEEPDEIRVVAEMPGVASAEVICTLNAGTLSIATQGEARYEKIIELPAPVEAASLQQSCHNGILEVRLRRAGAP